MMKRVAKILVVSAVCLYLLSGCSALSSLVKPGGINTNAMVGKENTQQVVASQKKEEIEVKDNVGETSVIKAEESVTAKTIDKVVAANSKGIITNPVANTVVAEKVEQVKTTAKLQEIVAGPSSKIVVTQNERYPFWLIFLLVLGWVLPTPLSMWDWMIDKWWRRKDKPRNQD